jgi:hypothetical protein
LRVRCPSFSSRCPPTVNEPEPVGSLGCPLEPELTHARAQLTRQPTRTYSATRQVANIFCQFVISAGSIRGPFYRHEPRSFTGRRRSGQGASSVIDRSSICNVSHGLHSSGCISAVISLCRCNFLACSRVRITGFPCSSPRIRAVHCPLPLGSWTAVPCPGIFKSLEANPPHSRQNTSALNKAFWVRMWLRIFFTYPPTTHMDRPHLVVPSSSYRRWAPLEFACPWVPSGHFRAAADKIRQSGRGSEQT